MCGLFWGFVFWVLVIIYIYLDFNNLRKIGVFPEDSNFLHWFGGLILVFIIAFPFYLINRFKSIKRFKEAGGSVNNATFYFGVGYIPLFLILFPIILLLGGLSQTIYEASLSP
jgi:hypothetical protein